MSIFQNSPSEVYVNGIKETSCDKKCIFSGERNNITLRFEIEYM